MPRTLLLLVFVSLLSLSHTAAQNPETQPLSKITPDNAAQLTEQRFVGAALPGELDWRGSDQYLHLETSLESYDYDVENLANPAVSFVYEGVDPALIRQRDYGADARAVFDQKYNVRKENGEIVIAISNYDKPEHILRTGMTSGFEGAVFSPYMGADTTSYVALKFAPEGYEHLPTTVQLWDLNTDRLIAILEQPLEIFGTVQFYADNTQLVVVTISDSPYGDFANLLQIYDVKSGEKIGMPYAGYPVFIPEPGENLVIYSSYPGLGHWNKTDKGTLECEGETATYGAAFSSIRADSKPSDYRGYLAASGYNNVLVWPYTTGGNLGECFILRPPQENTTYNPMNISPDLVFSPDAKFLAIAYDDQVEVWDLDQQAVLGTFPNDRRYSEITFSPDSASILLNAPDYRKTLWDIISGERLSEFSASAIFNHDWSRAVYWNGGDLQLVRPMNGQITTLPVIENYLGRLIAVDSVQHLAVFDKAETLTTLDMRTGQLTSEPLDLNVKRIDIGRNTAAELLQIRDETAASFTTLLPFQPDDFLLSPNGQYLATLERPYGDSPAIYLWDVETEQLLAWWYVQWYGENTFAFSPDNRLIASMSDSAIALWDIEANKQQYASEHFRAYGMADAYLQVPQIDRYSNSPVHEIAFSADRQWLAAQVEINHYESEQPPQHRVYVWSLTKALDGITPTSTDEERQITEPDFTFDNLDNLSFVPGKSILLGKDREMDQLGLWDLNTGERMSTFGGNAISAFSPDGQVLVTMSWEDLYVWDVNDLLTGEAFPLKVLRGSGKDVTRLSFDPEGEMLFAERPDGVKVFTVDTSKMSSKIVILSPVPDHIEMTKENIQDLELLNSFSDGGYTSDFAISPDQRRLVTGGSTREVNGEEFGLVQWDLATGELVRGIGDAEAVSDVMWSPDGQYIATMSSEAGGEAGWPVLRLLDFQSGAEQAYLRGPLFATWRMAFDPKGKFLITSISGQPGQLALWNLHDILKRHDVYNTQANYLQLRQDNILASTVASMPGTSLFAIAEQKVITLMDETRKPVQTFNGDWDYVSALTFSRDGSLLIASVEKIIPNSGGSMPDRTEVVGIYIWRTATGERLKFIPYTSYIAALTLNPDGSLLAVSDLDGQVNIYETLTDHILETFTLFQTDYPSSSGSETIDLEFNSDGTLLISATGNGVKLWGVRP